MTQPLVCAVMLTKDRPEMAKRAVESFRAQTYRNKSLIVWDTSLEMDPSKRLNIMELRPHCQHAFYGPQEYSIGRLRNNAIKYGAVDVSCAVGEHKQLIGRPDIIVHWDDDDYSHPFRIEEQVNDLMSSGADAVGYSDLMFWRVPRSFDTANTHPKGCACGHCDGKETVVATITYHSGEAWQWFARTSLTPPPGSSLMYKREAWERHNFKDTSQGEDWDFWKHCNGRSYPSMREGEPRLIASIHGGNTSAYNLDAEIGKAGSNWKRLPEWDERLKEIMKL